MRGFLLELSKLNHFNRSLTKYTRPASFSSEIIPTFATPISSFFFTLVNSKVIRLRSLFNFSLIIGKLRRTMDEFGSPDKYLDA
jgi:hypothetical protein